MCIIGAGPSGMSALYNVERLRAEGTTNLPDVVCFEKQASWGGLWVYDWRTGQFDTCWHCTGHYDKSALCTLNVVVSIGKTVPVLRY